MFGNLLDQRQLVNRLGVVGHRAVGVDRDGHRAHAEKSEGHQTESKHRGAATISAVQPHGAEVICQSTSDATMLMPSQ